MQEYIPHLKIRRTISHLSHTIAMATPTPLHDSDDWEILHNPNPNPNPFHQHSIDSAAIVESDYFSLGPTAAPPDDARSVGSDNPSWVEPDSMSDSSASAAPAAGEEEEAEEPGREGGGGDGAGERAWWKMPLEIIRVCVLRARPVWSISVAAAIVGALVMLGRRIYRMRQKSPSVPLRIAIDDKKASQFMTQAARLNEAFSVVKRAPIIRPSYPAGSVTPWPLLALR